MPHLCIVWEQKLLCCQFFLKICGTQGCVPGVFVQGLPGSNSVRELVYLGNPWCAYCRLNFVQLPTSQTDQQVFAIVPGLIPVQLHELLPMLLLQSWKSRNVATLGPFHSTRHRLQGSTRRLAASSFLHSSLPVSVQNAPDQKKSPLASTTRFSNSGRSSFRTDLASDSSAPPTRYVTSYRFDCGEDSILDG